MLSSTFPSHPLSALFLKSPRPTPFAIVSTQIHSHCSHTLRKGLLFSSEVILAILSSTTGAVATTHALCHTEDTWTFSLRTLPTTSWCLLWRVCGLVWPVSFSQEMWPTHTWDPFLQSPLRGVMVNTEPQVCLPRWHALGWKFHVRFT